MHKVSYRVKFAFTCVFLSSTIALVSALVPNSRLNDPASLMAFGTTLATMGAAFLKGDD